MGEIAGSSPAMTRLSETGNDRFGCVLREWHVCFRTGMTALSGRAVVLCGGWHVYLSTGMTDLLKYEIDRGLVPGNDTFAGVREEVFFAGRDCRVESGNDRYAGRGGLRRIGRPGVLEPEAEEWSEAEAWKAGIKLDFFFF